MVNLGGCSFGSLEASFMQRALARRDAWSLWKICVNRNKSEPHNTITHVVNYELRTTWDQRIDQLAYFQWTPGVGEKANKNLLDSSSPTWLLPGELWKAHMVYCQNKEHRRWNLTFRRPISELRLDIRSSHHSIYIFCFFFLSVHLGVSSFAKAWTNQRERDFCSCSGVQQWGRSRKTGTENYHRRSANKKKVAYAAVNHNSQKSVSVRVECGEKYRRVCD